MPVSSKGFFLPALSWKRIWKATRPRYGAQFWKDLVSVRPLFWPMLSLLWGTTLLFASGLIGGVVRLCWQTLFLFFFLIALTLRSQSLSSPIITETWASIGPFLPKNWGAGIVLRLCSRSSRRRRTRLPGPMLCLGSFPSSLFILIFCWRKSVSFL